MGSPSASSLRGRYNSPEVLVEVVVEVEVEEKDWMRQYGSELMEVRWEEDKDKKSDENRVK